MIDPGQSGIRFLPKKNDDLDDGSEKYTPGNSRRNSAIDMEMSTDDYDGMDNNPDGWVEPEFQRSYSGNLAWNGSVTAGGGDNHPGQAAAGSGISNDSSGFPSSSAMSREISGEEGDEEMEDTVRLLGPQSIRNPDVIVIKDDEGGDGGDGGDGDAKQKKDKKD